MTGWPAHKRARAGLGRLFQNASGTVDEVLSHPLVIESYLGAAALT